MFFWYMKPTKQHPLGGPSGWCQLLPTFQNQALLGRTSTSQLTHLIFFWIKTTLLRLSARIGIWRFVLFFFCVSRVILSLRSFLFVLLGQGRPGLCP